MMRLLALALLLLATAARAQDVTTHLVNFYGGSGIQNFAPLMANQLACWRLPARLGITGATKLAGAIPAPTPFNHACTVSFAIYTDVDTISPPTLLALATGDCAHAGIVSATGLTPFSLVQGTIYRWCVCQSMTQGNYLGIVEANSVLAATKSDVLNAVTLRAAITAVPCLSGVAQGVTGAMTTAIPTSLNGNGAGEVPMMVVE